MLSTKWQYPMAVFIIICIARHLNAIALVYEIRGRFVRPLARFERSCCRIKQMNSNMEIISQNLIKKWFPIFFRNASFVAMIDEHGAMCTRVRLAGKLSESIWVAWCCFFSMPALLFIVCFLIALCDYPVFRIGLHSVRCAEPLQLNCSVRKQENRLRKWIASSWIIFNIIVYPMV